jgi:hypothetical protein
LSLATDPTPSWKPEHPIEEEQKAVQWTLLGKAQKIASKHQSLMDWLTPLYVAKVLAVVVARPAAEQKSPIVELEGPAVVANRLVAEQKPLTVV